MVTRRGLAAVAAAVVLAAVGTARAEEKVFDGCKIVKTGDGSVTVSDPKGQEHTAAVASDAQITLNGKTVKLADLKSGTTVKLTVQKESGAVTVTKLEGRS